MQRKNIKVDTIKDLGWNTVEICQLCNIFKKSVSKIIIQEYYE